MVVAVGAGAGAAGRCKTVSCVVWVVWVVWMGELCGVLELWAWQTGAEQHGGVPELRGRGKLHSTVGVPDGPPEVRVVREGASKGKRQAGSG